MARSSLTPQACRVWGTTSLHWGMLLAVAVAVAGCCLQNSYMRATSRALSPHEEELLNSVEAYPYAMAFETMAGISEGVSHIVTGPSTVTACALMQPLWTADSMPTIFKLLIRTDVDYISTELVFVSLKCPILIESFGTQ